MVIYICEVCGELTTLTDISSDGDEEGLLVSSCCHAGCHAVCDTGDDENDNFDTEPNEPTGWIWQNNDII
jgi:hypothetical protein